MSSKHSLRQLDRHVQQALATSKWTGMSIKRWQLVNGLACPAITGNHQKDRLIWRPANGQACPASIGNKELDRHVWQALTTSKMDRHVRQALATSRWTGISIEYWQLVNGQACPAIFGNHQMDRLI